MSGKIIIANWKMNGNTSLAIENNNFLSENVNNPNTIIICPPTIFLNQFDSNKVNIGAQDISVVKEEFGAFTGELSGKMLKYIGCRYVLIGHSERRKIFNENNKILLEKLQAAIHFGLTPIFCIGETKEEMESKQTENVLREQISILKDITSHNNTKIIIAYEPVWSIGTGIIPKKEEVSKIYDFLNKLFDINTKIVYGGSVSISNAKEILTEWSFDGVLVGGASLKLSEFKQIISYVS